MSATTQYETEIEKITIPTDSQQKAKYGEKLRLQGNEHFKAKRYNEAIFYYTQALRCLPEMESLYTNRSLAHFRLESFGASLQDANEAIRVSGGNSVKGYWRRAEAHVALLKHREAIKDFKQVVVMQPNNRAARAKHASCTKEARRIAFEAAIATEEECHCAKMEPNSVAIPSDYDGVHFSDDQESIEFPLSEANIRQTLDAFKAQKLLAKRYVYAILKAAHEYFSKQPTLVHIEVPKNETIKVCGDTHGQFYDVAHLFSDNLAGLPSKQNRMLFNGDFVDRGSFSCEIILSFLLLKLTYPEHFFMSRGNHETLSMNRMYGFEGEVKHKYGVKAFDMFLEVFRWLPLAHVINNKVLVVHGGLFSKDNVKLDDIKKIDRNREPPDEGLMCELLWSDPMKQPGRAPSKRGVAISFGPDVVERFLNDNDLELLVRSHEVKENGYEVEPNGKCITVFSAPNYCDQVGNKGAFITFEGSTMQPKFTTYTHVPHPNVPPMSFANPLMR